MAELIKIKAGFATVGQGAGPMMVTWKAGLFHKHGLDVDRPPVLGGAKGVVRSLMSGEIQFGNLAAPAPLRANLKGEADVVFLTGGINQQFLVGRPGINSREELAGKKIGTVNDGGIGDALVKFVTARLDAAGINGLQSVTIGHGAAAEMDALLSGKVDVVVGTPPECTTLPSTMTPGVARMPQATMSWIASTFSSAMGTPSSLATASTRCTVARQFAQPVPSTLTDFMALPLRSKAPR